MTRRQNAFQAITGEKRTRDNVAPEPVQDVTIETIDQSDNASITPLIHQPIDPLSIDPIEPIIQAQTEKGTKTKRDAVKQAKPGKGSNSGLVDVGRGSKEKKPEKDNFKEHFTLYVDPGQTAYVEELVYQYNKRVPKENWINKHDIFRHLLRNTKIDDLFEKGE